MEVRAMNLDAALSDLAAKLVNKYGDGTAMGPSVLFPSSFKIDDVRSWLARTKFRKVQTRVYTMTINDHRVVGELDYTTYGLWCMLLTASPLKPQERL